MRRAVSLELQDPRTTTVTEEVTFPFYRNYDTDDEVIEERVDYDGAYFTITRISYNHRHYESSVSIRQVQRLPFGQRDEVLGEGIYAGTEEGFNKALGKVTELMERI